MAAKVSCHEPSMPKARKQQECGDKHKLQTMLTSKGNQAGFHDSCLFRHDCGPSAWNQQMSDLHAGWILQIVRILNRADSCQFLNSIGGSRQTPNPSRTLLQLCYRRANGVLFYGFL